MTPTEKLTVNLAGLSSAIMKVITELVCGRNSGPAFGWRGTNVSVKGQLVWVVAQPTWR